MDTMYIIISVIGVLIALHIISSMISTVSHVYRFFHLGVRAIYFIAHWVAKLRTKQ